MLQNGSPVPRFDFDEARSYFRVTLPAHPEYQAILALQDVASLKAVGDAQGALQRLKDAYAQSPAALGLALELAREFIAQDDVHAAETVYEQIAVANPVAGKASLVTLIAAAYLDKSQPKDAMKWLDKLPLLDAVGDAFDAAIQEKRAGRMERAHRYFQVAGDAVKLDAKALHEFAQVKMKLADKARPRGQQDSWTAYNRLLDEAREMLQRVVQMDAPRTRHAWAWFDLGNVLKWSRLPRQEVRHAFEQAIQCEPGEIRFQQALERLGSERG